MALTLNPATFRGMQIIANPAIEPYVYVPVRKLKKKAWHKDRCYHARVQKKWIKRFGTTKEHNFYMVSGNIICSPEGEAELRRTIQDLRVT